MMTLIDHRWRAQKCDKMRNFRHKGAAVLLWTL
jgi:hypothetical protein